MPLIVGCAGRARHGKGSTAEFVKDWADAHSVRAQIISFADPLKDFLTLIVGRSAPFRGNPAQRSEPVPELPWSKLENQICSEASLIWPDQNWDINPTGRQLMQLFGTEVVRRHFCGDTWVMIAGNRAKAFDGITIIDDVRFPNEAKKRDAAGIIDVLFKIIRPGIPNINHPSEDAVDTIPIETVNRVFENDGDLVALKYRVSTWLESGLSVENGVVSVH